jgi:hypothetical protein
MLTLLRKTGSRCEERACTALRIAGSRHNGFMVSMVVSGLHNGRFTNL